MIADLGRTSRIHTTLYAMPARNATMPPTPPRPEPIQLEVGERWTGSLTESEKRRVLPKPRQPARVR